MPCSFQNHSGGKSKGSGGEIYTFMILPYEEKSKFFSFLQENSFYLKQYSYFRLSIIKQNKNFIPKFLSSCYNIDIGGEHE